MKNLLLIFMLLFAVDSIAQLDQREKGDVVSPALNKNPNFIQKTGWTIEAIDPINDTLCSVTPSSDNLTILTTNVCNARVYQDINSADIRKARFEKETMTALLKIQALTYVKITLNVYKKAATTGTLTLLRTRSLENNSNVPLRDKKIVFDVVTDDLNFVTNANLADSLRIEFTFEPTVVFPAGVAKVEVNDFRVFSSLLNYSPLIHEIKEESGWTEWQPMTITATTTNPTLGTGGYNFCRKRRDSVYLEVEGQYYQTVAGAAGSGPYRFSCGGLVLNGQSLTVDEDRHAVVGVVAFNTGGTPTTPTGTTFIDNTTGLIYLRYLEGDVGSSSLPLSDPTVGYRFTARIPIKEWKQSTVAMSSQNDISNPKNWSKFSATVNAAGTGFVSNTSSGIISSASKASNIVTVNFTGLTSIPDCSVSGIDGTGNEGVYRGARITSLTSSSLTYITSAAGSSSAGYVALPTVIKCEKTGQDYVDAWKKTATAYLKESNIEKDVEQFHTDERKICDRCYKGKALYKKCWNSGALSNNAVLANGATEVVRTALLAQINELYTGALIGLPFYTSSTNRIGFSFSSGNLIYNCSTSRCGDPIRGCIEYSKD